MDWVSPFVSVPIVLDVGGDETGSWLVTTAVAGKSAVSDGWKRRPRAAVEAIGQGLRYLHDHAPVENCPFSWSAGERIEAVHRRVKAGTTAPYRWHPVHQTLSIEVAFATLERTPSIDQLVVCHGDACAPNTIVTDDGEWSGLVDLGTLGVADRWADLAVATWSTEWNYGPGWEGILLDAYGIAPDLDRMNYYRLLWDLA